MRKMKSEGWRPAASAALPGFTVLTFSGKKLIKFFLSSQKSRQRKCAFVDSCIKKHQLVKPKEFVKLESRGEVFPKINWNPFFSKTLMQFLKLLLRGLLVQEKCIPSLKTFLMNSNSWAKIRFFLWEKLNSFSSLKEKGRETRQHFKIKILVCVYVCRLNTRGFSLTKSFIIPWATIPRLLCVWQSLKIFQLLPGNPILLWGKTPRLPPKMSSEALAIISWAPCPILARLQRLAQSCFLAENCSPPWYQRHLLYYTQASLLLRYELFSGALFLHQ